MLLKDRPPLICLTGIDGCGKSTQANLLVERLRAAGFEVEKAWTGGRPYLSRPIVNLVRRRNRAPVPAPDGTYAPKEAGDDGRDEFAAYLDRSNRMFERWWILRRGWTDVSMLEHAVEANLAVRPHLLRGKAVVCDRYLYKSVVNLSVLMNLKPSAVRRLLRHPAFWLAPRPTIYFLLDVPAEVGFARKTDIPSIEYVRRRVPVYRELARRTNMPVIDATQDPDDVADDIWAVVSTTLGLDR